MNKESKINSKISNVKPTKKLPTHKNLESLTDKELDSVSGGIHWAVLDLPIRENWSWEEFLYE